MADIISEDNALDRAAELIAGGGIVAVPTETVYGLAGDAAYGDAVAAIFEAKGRPRFNPLICHVSGLDMAMRVGDFPELALRLARKFWPGPLTLVVPLKPDAPVHPLVTAGLDTVALRNPRGFVSQLSGRLDRPLAAPSANRSGRITATTADAVAADLGDRIALIVDGGPCAVGLESTIVKVDGDRLMLLRPGGITGEEIAACTGVAPEHAGPGNAIEAPGMMTSHYAPRARLRLDAADVRSGEALLGFGASRAANAGNARAFANLSPAGDLREAAVNLFSYLNMLDKSGADVIAVEPVPGEGLGEAINDRLARAAAPRDSIPGSR